MICVICGHQLKNGEKFCICCGAEVMTSESSAAEDKDEKVSAPESKRIKISAPEGKRIRVSAPESKRIKISAPKAERIKTPVQDAGKIQDSDSTKKRSASKSSLLYVIAGILTTAVVLAVLGHFIWSGNSGQTEEERELAKIEEDYSEEDSQEPAPSMEELPEEPEEPAGGPDISEEEEPEAEEVSEEVSQYFLPTSSSEYLTMSDIEGFSQADCRLARNELYARHGRRFDDPNLQAYFDACDWYEGTIAPADFNDSVMNEYELANRDLIVQYEKDMGYR